MTLGDKDGPRNPFGENDPGDIMALLRVTNTALESAKVAAIGQKRLLLVAWPLFGIAVIHFLMVALGWLR